MSNKRNSGPWAEYERLRQEEADKKKSRLIRWGLVVGAVLLVAFIAFNWAWGAQNWKGILLSGLPLTVGVVLTLAIVGVTVLLAFRAANTLERRWTDKSVKKPLGAVVLAIILPLALVGYYVTSGLNMTYWSQSAFIADGAGETEITDGILEDDYSPRVPFEIAQNQVDANLQDTTGERQNVRSVVTMGETGDWNTLIVRTGWWQGYESLLSVDAPAFGNVVSSQVDQCRFGDGNTLRFGGFLPHNNLDRAILEAVLFQPVTFNQSDAYAYCNEEGEPVVVTPLIESSGGFLGFGRSWVPFGLALYNGATGTLEITQNQEVIDATPGPVYPISLATAQREALQSMDRETGEVVDWSTHAQGQAGWDTTGGNSEYQLRYTDADGNVSADYVTPMTSRGSGSTVIAVMTIDATSMTPGERNDTVINTLPEFRASDGQVVDQIRNDYSYMPEFAGNRYNFYEVAPGTDGGWVATVGTPESVVYRVVVGPDGYGAVLTNAEGPVGMPAAVPDEGDPAAPADPAAPVDLTQYSDEDLVRIITEASEILADR